MEIKILIENTTDSELKSEHGLSLYIEYRDKKILLDAGSTDAFMENAKMLDVDLSTVDMAFLSHGHYDHSGGFDAFMKINNHAPVYAMETALDKYFSASGGALHEISVKEVVKEVLSERMVPVSKTTEVSDGIVLVPHSTPGLEGIGKRTGLYKGNDGELLPDDFAHEMSVVFRTEAGLVICNSCSHGGVRNIVGEVKKVFPNDIIYAYIGGLHMKGRKDGVEICTFTKEEVKELTDYIKAEKIQLLITGHCTGAPALKFLREELEEKSLIEMRSGMTYDFHD